MPRHSPSTSTRITATGSGTAAGGRRNISPKCRPVHLSPDLVLLVRASGRTTRQALHTRDIGEGHAVFPLEIQVAVFEFRKQVAERFASQLSHIIFAASSLQSGSLPTRDCPAHQPQT